MLSVRRQLLRCSIRRYATMNDNVDHHRRLELHDWPKSNKPTPYEIFDINESETNISTMEMNKKLKKTYTKFVKIYHPDTSTVVADASGNQLTPELMRSRFDQIQEAYDILKDPRRRMAYRRYSSTKFDDPNFRYTRPPSGEDFSQQNFYAYRQANAHRRLNSFNNNEQFWQAGTWDDYYRMKYNRGPPTRDELNKNKYKILAAVVLIGALSFSLQIMLAIDKTHEYDRQVNLMNLKTLNDLNDSRENYGGGATGFDRIQRFLLSRRSHLHTKEENEDPNEDRKILTQYAQQKVRQWDSTGDGV